MKLLKTILFALTLVLLINCKNSEPKVSFVQSDIDLPTIQCGMCKTAIESKIASMEGVKSIVVDQENKKGHVKYQKDKVSIEEIEKVITDLGYRANDQAGNPDAYAKLPGCCKIPE